MKIALSIITSLVIVFSFAAGCNTERRGTTDTNPAVTSASANAPTADASVPNENAICSPTATVCTKAEEGRKCRSHKASPIFVCHDCFWVHEDAASKFTNPNCR